MRHILILLLAGVAATPAAAQPAPPLPAVKPIPFTQRTLANGLRVYAIRDASTPNVAIQVWYDVGGRDDPRGRSGFAHLFEHLMFKATRNLAAEQFDRLTEDVGGYNNASTGDDYTNYFEVVPANHLQRLLFAEAERMASLVVEPAAFASERDVVKEEFRQSVLARPYGKLDSLYLPALAYQRHPYARGVIGSIADLDSATIDDVRAFHATYYRPDNAILVIAGNFDAAALDRWVDQYFAPIRRPAQPIPRVTVDEPVRDRPVALTVHEPNTPLPAIALSYPLPPDRAQDMPALMVMAAILSRGESSRLHESLVYRQGIAQSADATLDTRAGPGKLDIIALAAGGKEPAAVERALQIEIARMRDTPVTPAELAEAQTEILTDALKATETAEGRAHVIAASVLIDGDPRATERQLAAVRAVTIADVQRVARLYLADRRVATIRYLPADGAAAPAGPAIAVADSVVTRPLTVPADMRVITAAAPGDRAPLPPLGPEVTGEVPLPVETRLANGLRVVTVERHDVPLVTARLVGQEGAARDAAGKAGTASLAATLLTRGTETRSATAIARDAEALGASIDASAGRQGSAIGITVATPALPQALAIVADAARHATLAPDELERARAQAIDAASVSLTEPMTLAGLVADRALFGTSGYGGAVDGTPRSLKAITRADVRAAYAAAWSPDRATLVLTGDITPDAARKLAERAFGDWRATGAPPALAAPDVATTPRLIVVDLPDAGQAGVVVARGAITRGDPRYYPALLADTVLGNGFTSRLNQEIRIKRGLSYGAGSRLSADRTTGFISAGASTKNATAPQVIALVTGEMRRLGATPIAESELATRRSVLIGGFGRQIERTAGLAGIVAEEVLAGVPVDTMTHHVDAIRATGTEAVQAAARALFDPATATIVVAGDARQFVAALPKEPAAEVIPAAALDLDRATLR